MIKSKSTNTHENTEVINEAISSNFIFSLPSIAKQSLINLSKNFAPKSGTEKQVKRPGDALDGNKSKQSSIADDGGGGEDDDEKYDEEDDNNNDDDAFMTDEAEENDNNQTNSNNTLIDNSVKSNENGGGGGGDPSAI